MAVVVHLHHCHKGILSKLSYGTTFGDILSNVSELFSKMEFLNDFGFFADEKYMLIVLGKIAKCTQRHLGVLVKYEAFIS